MTEQQGDDLIDLVQMLVDHTSPYSDVLYYYEVPSSTYGNPPASVWNEQVRVVREVSTGDLLVSGVLILYVLFQVVRSVFNAARGLAV